MSADEPQSEAPAVDAPGSQARDVALDDLRAILVGEDRERIASLEDQIRLLGKQVEDKDGLIALLTPVLGDVLRAKIRDSRDEMIESLYPIIGQLITRSVTEAIRDLARTIDARMRNSLSPQSLLRRLRARVRGVSDAELLLRESLPFTVSDVFLIHRETGLLLCHVSQGAADAADSDLISGMLTAIRDFVQDALGGEQEGQLDEIQYGQLRILIEATRHAYLAVVMDGIEPPGFRERMRERIMAVEARYEQVLLRFDGNVEPFRPAAEPLRELMNPAPPEGERGLSRVQKRLLAGLGAVLVLCALAACLAGVWFAGFVRRVSSQPPVVVVTATATPAPPATLAPAPTTTPIPSPTALPTATRAPTQVPTAMPTPAATPAPAPPTATPAPTTQVMGSVVEPILNIRTGPGPSYAVVGVFSAGRSVLVLGRSASSEWLLVCCMATGQPGWVAAPYVSLAEPRDTVPIVPEEEIR